MLYIFSDNIEETMNKTVYTTYHSVLPPIVLNRWRELNPDYTIDFSLDVECFNFIDTQFNRNLSSLFSTIRRGMYKADLWRLCQLYVNGGVYADVDLVPLRSLSQITASAATPPATFYSCLSMVPAHIFQAFMVHTQTRSPLILGFLSSFLYNKPYLNMDNGPTTDMYHFILYNVRAAAGAAGAAAFDIPDSLQPYTHYTLRQIRIPVRVSSIHDDNIPLHYFPEHIITYTVSISPNTQNKWVLANQDKYKMKIEEHQLIFETKPDSTGVEEDGGLIVDICIDLPDGEPEVVYLFKEAIREPNKISTCYISDSNGMNIMDCRDANYIRDYGWLQ